jgi:hypothetical protein
MGHLGGHDVIGRNLAPRCSQLARDFRVERGIDMTKLQRLTIILTAFNFMLLVFGLAQLRPVAAQGVAPLLRARALEIVDEQGRVRAEIRVMPAQPSLKMPDGTTGYPEAVQLRLISSQNSPNVKLVTTEDGSGLVLGGDKGHTQLLSRGTDPFITIVTKDGRERTMKP